MSPSTKRKPHRSRAGLAVNLIGATVLLLLVFGVIVSSIGLFSFTDAFKKEYSTSTYHMADTATTLINSDHLEAYLTGDETEEYLQSREYLDAYCKKIHVSLIYVILVDRSDYGRFVSVFNSVDNTVDDTEYTAWEPGHKRDTTNAEYRQKYKALYEQTVPYETVYRTKTTDGQHPHITTMVPVKNSSGDVAAILCMQRPIRELNEARRPFLRQIAISTALLAAAASVCYALYIRRQFVAPLSKVAGEASRFAMDSVRGEPFGKISRIKEISDLAVSVEKMEADMIASIRNLTAVTAEKERIVTELALASTIQESSVPNIFPAFPERNDFDICASMTPAKEVGGDFYNFFLIDDDHLALVIGDVSGKGIPAALFMMVTNILISDGIRLAGSSPADVLTFVNHDLCTHNQADMFVTVWVGILELSSGKLTAANAGHEYPVFKRPDGGYALFKDKHGLPVAAMDGVQYRNYEMTLEPGTKLFVYTDGVPEATDKEENMFGTERMLAALNAAPDAAPKEVLDNIRRVVDGFVNEAEQFDDLTMLCMEYKKEK